MRLNYIDFILNVNCDIIISMIIRKFLHSCILIESKGQKLLIDPGSFCFIEGKLKPEEIPTPDIILLTHEHADHYYPEALSKISRPGTKILSHPRMQALLRERGFESAAINTGETIVMGVFSIRGIQAPHEKIPTTVPENIGFIINEKFFHPGDSLSFVLKTNPLAFAMPISAPWLTWVNALETALSIKPRVVIPIHDAIIKDFWIQRMYDVSREKLESSGIQFKPLALNEVLEIPD